MEIYFSFVRICIKPQVKFGHFKVPKVKRAKIPFQFPWKTPDLPLNIQHYCLIILNYTFTVRNELSLWYLEKSTLTRKQGFRYLEWDWLHLLLSLWNGLHTWQMPKHDSRVVEIKTFLCGFGSIFSCHLKAEKVYLDFSKADFFFF